MPPSEGHPHTCWACRDSWIHDATVCWRRAGAFMTCPACDKTSDVEPAYVTEDEKPVESVCDDCKKRYVDVVRCEARDGYHYTEFGNGARLLSRVMHIPWGFTGHELPPVPPGTIIPIIGEKRAD